MPANILTVCDALVSAIEAGLDEPTDASVERLYLAPMDLATDTARHVWVFPARYSTILANRGEDEWTHTIGVIVAERYTDAGEPPVAWLDERVTFTEEYVYRALDFTRSLLSLGTGRDLVTQTAEATVYDDLRLSEKKLFWSELRFEFKEIKDA